VSPSTPLFTVPLHGSFGAPTASRRITCRSCEWNTVQVKERGRFVKSGKYQKTMHYLATSLTAKKAARRRLLGVLRGH
jgi:hypothetical protein